MPQVVVVEVENEAVEEIAAEAVVVKVAIQVELVVMIDGSY